MSALNVRAVSLRLLALLFIVGTLTLLPACPSGNRSKPADGKATPREAVAKDTASYRKMATAPKPGEAHNTETYNHIVDNPFLLAAKFPLSTFSIDVNTASYSNVRRFLLQEKKLPPKDAVRIAELVNYFEYDYAEPKGEHPIALATEVAECPWDTRLKLVRIGLQAKKISLDDLPPRNLVFLVDTSGSMDAPNRLPLLKQSLQLLTAQLRPQDRVAIVAYAGSAGLVLPSTPGTEREKIVAALNRLHAGGSTNGGEGIELAYKVAQQNFIKGGVNRVIIGTDGDFNVGITNEGDLVRLIEEKRRTGVYLSVLGFGMGNLKDATMEKLAHHGNGHYAYIDTLDEARKQFVDRGGALHTLANDVKIQVEFNPAKVHAYRLVGYENRLLKDQDFNDDRTDAGDLGAGHSVTAFYVIAPPGVNIDVPAIDNLKYQQPPRLSDAALTDEMLTVKVRYTPPDTTKSRLLTQPVPAKSMPFAQASSDFRFAAAVATFGMVLRDSPYKGTATYAQVTQIAGAALGKDATGHRAEFLQLVQIADQLAAKGK
jgi:Ca-activated chloride channel family protein